jgi:thiamine-phosphate diphosphorylase
MSTYSLYLVTDSGLTHPSRTLVQTVEEAIVAGVTIVQLREKTLSTKAFVELASAVHQVTKKYNVPLLINDRVDVALAVDCEGVHIGQSDMPIQIARKLLGPGKIIGVTVGTIEQALKAHQDGADYLGVGACFDTNTKKLEKIPFGPYGLRQIIDALPVGVKTVVIGGIKVGNATRVLQLSRASTEKVINSPPDDWQGLFWNCCSIGNYGST